MERNSRITFLKSAVCENGHLQTSTLKTNEKYIKDFCTQCGGKIYTSCPNCNAPILGGTLQTVEKLTNFMTGESIPKEYYYSNDEVPYYCHNCGVPYPWTEKFLNDYQNLLNLYEDEIDSELSQMIYITTEKLLQDRFSESSINTAIFKKCFGKLSDVTKIVFINAVSGFAGEKLKNYFLTVLK
ncbi:MAG: DUF2321 domain-containing protein [Fusobacterium sp.]